MSKIKKILKKKSNKVSHLDDVGDVNTITSRTHDNDDECLSIISVDLNTENVYYIQDTTTTDTFNNKRRMSQP